MIILELDALLSYEGLLVPLLLLDGLLGAALVLHQPLLDLVEPDVHLAVGGVDGGRQPHVLRLKCPQSEKFRSVTTQKFKLNTTVKFPSFPKVPCFVEDGKTILYSVANECIKTFSLRIKLYLSLSLFISMISSSGWAGLGAGPGWVEADLCRVEQGEGLGVSLQVVGAL